MMRNPDYLNALAANLRSAPGLQSKRDIAHASGQLRLNSSAVPVGDDCAAIPDSDGYLLFAIEGFINAFVQEDPWFAGWCGIMVNLSDIAAMGGRAIAVTDALWADGTANADPVLAGMLAASETYGIPVVGGHTNIRTNQSQLAVAILGRARKLLTSFDAKPGDCLIAAIDHRGAYREPFSNWQAALDAPPERLRGDLEILPGLAESGLVNAAKDISQGGLIGTAVMLAECSGVGLEIDLTQIPVPPAVTLERWLQSFPSFGFLLSVPQHNVDDVIAAFVARGIVAAEIGQVTAGSQIAINDHRERAVVFDFKMETLMEFGPPARLTAEAG